MFYPKKKYANLLIITKTIPCNLNRNISYGTNSNIKILNKSFSIFNKSKAINTKIITNKYNLKNECSFTVKNIKRDFCILEKIRENDNISKEEFLLFVTNFQNGEINLGDVPLKYKKFLKEIKLLPREPEEPDDCCGKDCVPCKIEFYHEKLDRRDEMIDDLYKKIYPDNNSGKDSDIAESSA